MDRLNWTDQAVADLKAIHDFIARDAASYAELLVEDMLERAEELLLEPERGELLVGAEEHNVRSIAVGGFRLLYRSTENEIQVLAAVAGN